MVRSRIGIKILNLLRFAAYSDGKAAVNERMCMGTGMAMSMGMSIGTGVGTGMFIRRPPPPILVVSFPLMMGLFNLA